MRVLFCDPLNTQNNFYVFAKYLRGEGVDAHVAMDSSRRLPEGHDPEWHDGKGLQEWVHRIEFPLTMNPLLHIKRSHKLIRLAKEFDVIVCSGHAPIWVQWSGKPFVFFSYGSDLDQEAVQGWSGAPRTTVSLRERTRRLAVRALLRGALRKADAVVLSPYQIPTAKKLGLKNLRHLPHIVDTSLLLPMDAEERHRRRNGAHKMLGCDLILFHPPRQVWTDRSIADCKGNDKVFRAVALFKQQYPGRVILLAANKGWDVAASKRLAEDLGIADNVVWFDPVPKDVMCGLYNTSDVVLDQFVVGVLALVSMEALACGTPVITSIDGATSSTLYPKPPPVANAHTEEDIYRCLCLLEDKEVREELGEKGRAWVEKYCQPSTAIPKYIQLLEEICRVG